MARHDLRRSARRWLSAALRGAPGTLDLPAARVALEVALDTHRGDLHTLGPHTNLAACATLLLTTPASARMLAHQLPEDDRTFLLKQAGKARLDLLVRAIDHSALHAADLLPLDVSTSLLDSLLAHRSLRHPAPAGAISSTLISPWDTGNARLSPLLWGSPPARSRILARLAQPITRRDGAVLHRAQYLSESFEQLPQGVLEVFSVLVHDATDDIIPARLRTRRGILTAKLNHAAALEGHDLPPLLLERLES